MASIQSLSAAHKEMWNEICKKSALTDAVKAVRRLAKEHGLPVEEALELLEEEVTCQGHESLDGAHMGETVYCDGSCR